MASSSFSSDGKIQYEMKGKLSGSGFGTNHFSSKGEFDMPTGAGAP